MKTIHFHKSPFSYLSAMEWGKCPFKLKLKTRTFRLSDSGLELKAGQISWGQSLLQITI